MAFLLVVFAITFTYSVHTAHANPVQVEVPLTVGIENTPDRPELGKDQAYTLILWESKYDKLTEIQRKTINAREQGTVEFDTLKFSVVGSYKYKVAQVPSENPTDKTEYDLNTYNFVVTVNWGTSGRLEASTVAFMEGSDHKLSEIVFHNKIKEPYQIRGDEHSIPNTSDNSDLWLYVNFALASLAILVASRFLSRRRTDVI